MNRNGAHLDSRISHILKIGPKIQKAALPKAKAEPDSAPDLLSGFLLNDHGNACRLIALYENDLRYCHSFRKWLVWDGLRWALDETDQAVRLAKSTMLEFIRQAIAKDKQDLIKFATGSLDRRRISSMLAMAEPEIYIRPDELDVHPDLQNFLNDTVDLRNGTLRSHRREDLITKVVHHNYLPDAVCPRWLDSSMKSWAVLKG